MPRQSPMSPSAHKPGTHGSSSIPTAEDWLAWGSSAVGDALRSLDHPFQSMDAGIHAVASAMKTAGPAYTVRTYPGATWALEQALEQASPGDVLVIDAGGRPDVIIMGELMSMRAQQRGIAGAVVDGAVRDINDIAHIGFPVFTRYVSPRGGTHAQVGQQQTPIACGRVVVNPGDIIVADESGVIVVPAQAMEATAQAAAHIKAREAIIAEHLRAGLDLNAAAAKANAVLSSEPTAR